MEAIASNNEIIKTGDPVLVRLDNRFNWRYTFFSHKCDEGTYATCYGNHVQCIPYKGNEYLVGTNNSWKSYKDKQNEWIKEHNIKIGDKVKIIKKSFKNDNGWNIHWRDIMDNAVNKIGIIADISTDAIVIDVKGVGVYWYPYHVLEKVESKFEFKFNAKVNGITSNDINVEGNLIGYNEKDRNTPYLVRTTKSQGKPTNGVMFWCKNIEYI